MVERKHEVRKDKAEPMVVAERKGEAGSGRERISKPSTTMAHRGAVAAAGEREKGESAREGAQIAAATEADKAGRSWWPTRAHLGCRMLATRRSSSAGAPRRHGAGARKGVSAGGLGRLRPAGQK